MFNSRRDWDFFLYLQFYNDKSVETRIGRIHFSVV